MSVSGILSSSFYNNDNQNIQNGVQQFRQEFQQLGQDLQSGNLSAAQSDFATLQQEGPTANGTPSAQSNNPIAQEFNQLSQDLQAGNLSAAQQDFTTLQSDLQSLSSQGAGHHHHHHHGGDQNRSNSIGQLMSQLGQALQSGNLSAAQQAYGSLEQDFQQFTSQNGPGSNGNSPNGTSSNSLSVNA